MKINIDRMMDLMSEWFDSNNDMNESNARYHREHPYITIWADNPRNSEEKHILSAARWADKHYDVILGIFEVLDMDREQRERAWIAVRAIRRWYSDTKYQFCPTEELLNRIEKFVF